MHGKTVLIVDDEPKIVEVLKAYLETEGFLVARAFSGSEAIRCFKKSVPDLIILDLMLPDLSGEEVCRAIRKKSQIPIIMLTAKTEEEDILNGLGIGADDYVKKPFSPREIVARVTALLRRVQTDAYSEPEIYSYNGEELIINNTRHEVMQNGTVVSLTPIEFKLLFTLMKYPTKTFTREELVNCVLDEDYQGYSRVIDSHIKNLRQKVEPNTDRPRYILTVHGIGYRFGGKS